MRFAALRTLFIATFGLGMASPALAGLDATLAAADPAEGERVFRKCAACHTVEQGEKTRVGPNLYGIVGGPVGAADGFRYSQALTAYGGEWTPERLDAFLTRPRAEVKGTRMGFPGLKKATDRADLIAYLNTFSDNPLNFGATGAAAPVEEAEEEYEFGILFDAPGVEETFYTCTACHSERIVAQQGLTRGGWDEVLEWMADEHGMSEIDEPDRSAILDYLAAHYNEDRPNFPSPVDN